MKAKRRNILLTEIGESIDLQNKLLNRFRRMAMVEDLTGNIRLAKITLAELENEFSENSSLRFDDTKESLEKWEQLKKKYLRRKTKDDTNYQM